MVFITGLRFLDLRRKGGFAALSHISAFLRKHLYELGCLISLTTEAILMSDRDIMWKLIERVVDGEMSIDKARYILGASGLLADFDYWIEEFLSDQESN
jgi:hypothetical protein